MKGVSKRNVVGLVIAVCLLVIWSVVFAEGNPLPVVGGNHEKAFVDLKDRPQSYVREAIGF
jgi:hypothetical protein